MIPENKKTAVANALQTTFGVSQFEDILEMTAGLSTALVYKIMVRKKPFLLKIITRTDQVSDPSHHYATMKAVGEAGIAPHVWYMNLEDKISITDFINAKPLPVNVARMKLPVLLKQLHAMPAFPNRMEYLEKMHGFVQKFRDANIMPGNLTNELLNAYENILSVYPRNGSDLVSCHNDLKPENILFDGERVWVVDWEAAFLNDRYLDLAAVGNFVIMNDDDERSYLQKYFGDELSDYHHARFFLMRQLLHVFFFIFLMILCNAANKSLDFNIVKPNFREFNDLLWRGKISLASAETKLQYGLVHFEQFHHNLRLKRFDESMRIVSGFPQPVKN